MKHFLAPLVLAVMMQTSNVLGVSDTSNLPTPTPTPGPVASAQQSAHLNRLKTRGAAEIDRRLDALQVALTKVQGSTKLADADKQALAKQVQDEINNLTALKSKLAADTSLDVARTDVQSIITEYRVYALMLPKARLTAAADRFLLVGGPMANLQAKLQSKINQAKLAGKDVASLQKTLDDMKAKLADAKSKYDGIPGKIISLQPADYNANHQILADYHAALKTAQADIKTARDDAKTIIAGLKDLHDATPTPSPSGSPTASPTASPAGAR